MDNAISDDAAARAMRAATNQGRVFLATADALRPARLAARNDAEFGVGPSESPAPAPPAAPAAAPAAGPSYHFNAQHASRGSAPAMFPPGNT